MNNFLLQIKELKTWFFTSRGTVKAVDGVNLEIAQGETVGLVGESGCGKSVLARSIPRLLQHPGRIVSGKILYQGTDLVKLPEEKIRRYRGNEISMIFQDPLGYLNPVMKVGDQIAESLRLFRKKENPQTLIPELFELVGFARSARIWERYPHELSGGMRQRVMIALAISCQPHLLIADEPTTALDVTIQAQVLNLLKQLCQELNMSMLLITHDLGIVADVCDRVYVMYAGRIVESADVFSIYENPSHPYTQGLLNASLSIEEFRDTLTTIEGTVPDPISLPEGCRFAPRCSQSRSICSREDPPCININEALQHRSFCWIGMPQYYEESSLNGTNA